MYRQKPTQVSLPSRLTAGLLAFWMAAPSLSFGQEDSALSPGTYKLEMIMASITRVPFLGSSKSASKSVSIVEIKRDATNFVQSHKVCDFRVLKDSAFIKMVFPAKFIAALGEHSYQIQLTQDGQGWSYRADLGIERIGYKPVDDKRKLPTKIDDPEVYDWDDDGHPAATLKLFVPLLPDGELYVVQRGHSILNGRVMQPGRIEGAIEVQEFEQRVLGAKPAFLNKSPEITPDPQGSRFTLTQVAAGSTCETLGGAAEKS